MSLRTILVGVCLLASGPALALSPGDLIINEVMPNPAAVPDSAGEWVEVYNPTNDPIDLLSLLIQDNVGSHTIGTSVVVPSHGYAVLGRSDDPSLNGGVFVDYQYAGIFLANGGDEVTLLDGATVVSGMNYGSSQSGRSRALRCALLPTVPANYPSTSTALTFGDGDAGTPGAYNQIEPDLDNDGIGDSCDLFPADPTNGLAPGLAPGDLVINEILPDPTNVPDSQGEWIEIYNARPDDVDLLGLTVADNFGAFDITTSVVVPGRGFALLTINADPGQNGIGVAGDVQYNGIFLANGGDEVEIRSGAVVIARAEYDEPPNNRGKSYALACPDSTTYDLVSAFTPKAANGTDGDGDGFPDACDPCPSDPFNNVDAAGVCTGPPPCFGVEGDAGVDLAHGLKYSCTSDRANPALLRGATVRCLPFYAFSDNPANVRRVGFYYDRDATGAPDQSERRTPYDVSGGNATNGRRFNPGVGSHFFTTEISFGDGSTEQLCTPYVVGGAHLLRGSGALGDRSGGALVQPASKPREPSVTRRRECAVEPDLSVQRRRRPLGNHVHDVAGQRGRSVDPDRAASTLRRGRRQARSRSAGAGAHRPEHHRRKRPARQRRTADVRGVHGAVATLPAQRGSETRRGGPLRASALIRGAYRRAPDTGRARRPARRPWRTGSRTRARSPWG